MWWNDLVGIPFEEKGRSPAAFDCWGLVRHVYKQHKGIELPSYLEVYETTDDRDALGLVIGQESKEKWHDPKTPAEFDVIILRLRGVPMHVGLVTKPGFMIHCARGIGVVHESFTSIKWRHNVMGFARHGTEPTGSICSPSAVQR